MNHKTVVYISVALSLILSLIFAFTLRDSYFMIISTIPLATLIKKYAVLYGFLISFFSFMSVYLEYPLSDSLKLSGTIGGIIGLPAFLIFVLYPLISGLTGLFSALAWSSIYELSGRKNRKKLADIKMA